MGDAPPNRVVPNNRHAGDGAVTPHASVGRAGSSPALDTNKVHRIAVWTTASGIDEHEPACGALECTRFVDDWFCMVSLELFVQLPAAAQCEECAYDVALQFGSASCATPEAEAAVEISLLGIRTAFASWPDEWGWIDEEGRTCAYPHGACDENPHVWRDRTVTWTGEDGSTIKIHDAQCACGWYLSSGADLTIENLVAAQRRLMERAAGAYGMTPAQLALRPLVQESAREAMVLMRRQSRIRHHPRRRPGCVDGRSEGDREHPRLARDVGDPYGV